MSRQQLKDEELSSHQAVLFPTEGRLLVRPIESEKHGSLYLPVSRERPTLGQIVRVGDDLGEEWGEGEYILFGSNSGMEVSVGAGRLAVKYIILRASEVLASVVWTKPAESTVNGEVI